MQIIIAPAKKMKCNDKYYFEGTDILFPEKTKELLSRLKEFSLKELKDILKCNDVLAFNAYFNYQNLDLDRLTFPAIMTYDGLVFKNLNFDTLDKESQEYLFNNLFILSSFYGALRPTSLIGEYRLDFNNDLDLYNYWSDSVYKLTSEDEVIINLASKEYSKLVEPFIKDKMKFIDVDFLVEVNGKITQKATLSKINRGKMVRFLAVNKIEDYNLIKEYKEDGFVYEASLSSSNHFVFLRKEK